MPSRTRALWLVAMLALAGCFDGTDSADVGCDLTIEASPVVLPVAEVTEQNLPTLTERLSATVRDHRGKPAKDKNVAFTLLRGTEQLRLPGGGTSTANGVAMMSISSLDPAADAWKFNAADSYQAHVQMGDLCSAVVSEPAPLTRRAS